jgi:hypothetical protein
MNDEDPRLEDDDEAESDELEAEILRANRPFASDRWGTTPEEEVAGEGLDRALAEEEPDDPAAGDGVSDDGLEIVDDELTDDVKELVDDAVPERDPFLAPEEAALTIRDDEPGVTDHDEELVDDDVDAVEEYLEEHDGPSAEGSDRT